MKRAQPKVSVYDLSPSFNVSLRSFFHLFFNPSPNCMFFFCLIWHVILYHKAFRTSTAQPHFSKIVPFASQPLDGSVPIWQHWVSALFFVLVSAWLSISVWGVCPDVWVSGVQRCWSQLYKLQSGVKGHNRRHLSLWQQPLRWHRHHLVWRLSWTSRTSLEKYLLPIRTGWVFAYKYIHLFKINCLSYSQQHNHKHVTM